MRFGVGVLVLLVAATIPALIVAGSTSLRGLGWLLLIGAAVVLLMRMRQPKRPDEPESP